MKRQIPRPHDLRPLLQFKRPAVNPTRRRLDAALTIADLRRVARRRTPKAAFDYADGAAEAEISLARARRAFAGLQFNPAILRDVSTVDTGWEVLGKRVELPFGIAPTGFTRMMQAEGERAGAAAAAAAGIPFALSTMGTTSIEDAAAAAPDGRNWFQLYMWRDRDRSMALSTGPPRPDTTPCSSPSTSLSPGLGCATSGTASRSRPSSPPPRLSTRCRALHGGSTS